MRPEETLIMDNHNDNIEKVENSPEGSSFKQEKVEIDRDLFENSTLFCETKEKKKESRLSPIKKGIISIGSLAVVTAIVLVVVLFVLPDNKDTTATDSSSTASTAEISVMSIADDRIKIIELENEKDSFTIYPDKVEADDGTVSYAWLVKGYEHIDFSTPQYIASAVTKISAIKRFDIDDDADINNNADDSSDADGSSGSNSETEDDLYGFESPYANLAVTLNDGSKYTVTVGNVSPDKTGRYTAISGEGDFEKYQNSAYLIDSSVIDCVGNRLVDCVNMISAPAFVAGGEEDTYYSDGELVAIDHLYIGGTLHKKKIKVISPTDDLSLLSYMIEEPDDQAAKDESVNNILTLTTGVYNSGAFALDYTKADLKKYGLDNPYVTYNIKVGDRILDIKFSKKDSDGYYAYTVSYSTDGGKTTVDNNIIYKLGATGYEYIENKSNEIYFEKLFIEYVKYVESMTVTIGEQKPVTFTLDHDEDNASNFTVSTGKKEIDKDQFCYYYTRLLYLEALENADSSYKVGSDFAIKFNITYTEEGKQADEIVLYPYDKNVRRYVYQLNGKGSALVSSTLVEDLIDCLKPLESGEEIGNRYEY